MERWAHGWTRWSQRFIPTLVILWFPFFFLLSTLECIDSLLPCSERNVLFCLSHLSIPCFTKYSSPLFCHNTHAVFFCGLLCISVKLYIMKGLFSSFRKPIFFCSSFFCRSALAKKWHASHLYHSKQCPSVETMRHWECCFLLCWEKNSWTGN